MSIIKRDNQTSIGQGISKKEMPSLVIGQSGQINVPFVAATLNSTNVAHLAVSRVEHTFPCKTSYATEYFDEPPILLSSINYLSASGNLLTSGGGTRQTWIPFDSHSVIWKDSTTEIVESRYSLVTTKYIYFCVLTIRRAGTWTGAVGGGNVYYYLMFPKSSSLDAGGLGGGPTPDGTYCLYDYYTYDKDNNMLNSGSGSIPLGSGVLLSNYELDSYEKYGKLLTLVNFS